MSRGQGPRESVREQQAPGREWWRVWSTGLLVAVAVLAAALSLDAVFQDPPSGWLPPAARPLLAGLAGATLVRSLGPRMIRPLAVGLVVAAWTWCHQWWPDALAGGVVPRGPTLEAIADSAVQLQETIWTDIIPVTATPAVLAGLGAALALTALVADALAAGLRSPALAGLPLLILIGAAAALTAGSTPWLALAVAAAAWLGLLALDRGPAPRTVTARTGTARTGSARPRTVGTARWGTVAAAVVALVALGAAQTGLPMLTSGLAPEGRRIILGPGSGPVDPASDLGERLRSGTGYAGITYETEDDRGVYLRTAVVDDVMSVPWAANPPEYAGAPSTVDLAPAATRLDPPAASEEDDAADADSEDDGRPWDLVTVTLERWRGNWVPLPDQALAVEPSPEGWSWQLDPRTSTGYRGGTDPVDTSYRTAVLPIEVGLEELAAQAGRIAPQEVFNRWGADEELEGSELQRLAEDLTDGSDTTVERAAALQEYLLSDRFTYSETAPVDRGYDGTGLEMTEQFLDAGAGYCIHFASAMVMMAQSVDIPARVVVGYAPVAGTGGQHRVTADRAHAWPELYLAGIGWVPFEPTPTVGRIPGYSQPEQTQAPTPAADPMADASGPSPDASPSEPSPTDDAGPGGSGGPGTSGAPAVPLATVLTVAVVLALVVLVLATPAWLRRRRRNRRLVDGSVAGLWAELEDTAVDLGVGREAHESEQVFAARLGVDPAVAEGILWARYAPADEAAPDAGTLVPAVRTRLTELEESAEPAVRRRARWFPRSLVPEPFRR